VHFTNCRYFVHFASKLDTFRTIHGPGEEVLYTLWDHWSQVVPFMATLETFLCAFAKLRKATISFVMFVRLSVRLSAWNNSAPTEWIFMKFDIWWFFENLSRKLKFHKNRTTKKVLYRKTINIFNISRSFLLRMRNVSDKSCRENQNTHFVFSNFFSNIVPCMRKCGKNTVVRGKSQMTVWLMRIACSIPKATRIVQADSGSGSDSESRRQSTQRA
jgi:hypothetical protein